MVEITETFFAEDRNVWRNWLQENHSNKKEVWLTILKKHVKEPCVSYPEAVEEALCFGWIDGTLKRIDDRKHVIRFTPRKKNSVWAESNLERMERMISEGKMTRAGLEIFEARNPENVAPSVRFGGQDVKLPDQMERILKEDPDIWEGFNNMSQSRKNQYIYYILQAKKEETRIRRINKAIEMIKEENCRCRGK